MSKPLSMKAGMRRGDGAAGVLEGLPGRVAVDPVVDAPVVGQVELAEGGDRAEGRLLGAEVRAADEDGLDLVADPGEDLLEVRRGRSRSAARRSRGRRPGGSGSRRTTPRRRGCPWGA